MRENSYSTYKNYINFKLFFESNFVNYISIYNYLIRNSLLLVIIKTVSRV